LVEVFQLLYPQMERVNEQFTDASVSLTTHATTFRHYVKQLRKHALA